MTNIFVARLDYGVTQEELKKAFEQYGQVNKVSLATDKETGKSKGFAFIEMRNDDEAASAIKALDGQTMHGRQIAVKQAEDRSNGSPKRDSNNNNERKPFVRENKEYKETPNSYTKKESEEDDEPAASPEIFIPKPMVNKVVEKKKDPIMKKIEDRPKANKMQAYKKSGKQNRYFFDEDDDY